MANLRIWLLKLFVFGMALLPISRSSPSHLNFQTEAKDHKVRGTNLGGWLVVEGWIKPSLFKGIPNKEFLDGTTFQFKSVTTQKYLCANSGGGEFVVANCDETLGWEKFRLWRLNEKTFRLRVLNGQFVGLDGIQVVAVVINATDSETFEIIRESKKSKRVRIRAFNRFYLQAVTENLVTADVSEVSGWRNDDPTVFNFTIVKLANGDSQIHGDFQLQNGHGHEAARIMKEHYDTFIVEHDFKFMKENGINAVRIPVGWWTAQDPNPPSPFVSGTLNALDNAFSWAKKYKLKVIIDLHAAPGSQNGVAHSATRDGSLGWGKTYDTVEQTLDVIEFFAKRYGQHECLHGIELLNEPLYPYVTLKGLEDYSQDAYNIIHKYNPTVYVIFSVRLSFVDLDVPSYMELFPLANKLDNIIIDIHWYTFLFADNAKEYIDYIKINRTQQMTELLKNSGKALIYIGEWSCTWNVKNATPEELKEFAEAQIEVYDRASFGWSFWTWKNVEHNWSFKWLIEKGYVNLLDD